MAESPNDTPVVEKPSNIGRHVLLALVLVALIAWAGFWYVRARSRVAHLCLGSGVELRYRKGLADVLCEEAAARRLEIQIQPVLRSVEAIERVNRHELDAAVVPAGLAVPGENVRRVTMLECEVLHLLVKPELCKLGLAGLRGRRLNLGPADSGVGIAAAEVLKFIGLRPGEDYQADTHAYDKLARLSPGEMPDGVFSLSPLPSPLGERLVRQCGYQLLELPLGEAMAMRKPLFEDACIPPNTYGANPAVPEKPLHTVGLRAMLIAHRDVPKVAVRRLLETLYDSDFAHRVGMRSLDVNSLQRLDEYPTHAGALAYLHRRDPWIDQNLMADLQDVAGTIVSVIPAVMLAWHWYRRRQGDMSRYLRSCNALDLEAHQAACQGQFGELELGASLTRLAGLKADLLERHSKGLLAGDRQIVDLMARIDGLQQTLPTLVRTTKPVDRISLAFAPPLRKAG